MLNDKKNLDPEIIATITVIVFPKSFQKFY